MHSCVINVKILTKQNYGKYKSQNLDGDGEPRTADYSRTRLPESEPPLREGSEDFREGESVPLVRRGGGTPATSVSPQRAHAHAQAHPSTRIHTPHEHTPRVGLTSLPAHTRPPVRAAQLHTPPCTQTRSQLTGSTEGMQGSIGGTHGA